jgi:hypothetical protein
VCVHAPPSTAAPHVRQVAAQKLHDHEETVVIWAQAARVQHGADLWAFSSSSSSSSSCLHFQLRPACGLYEYDSQAALEHTQATDLGALLRHPPQHLHASPPTHSIATRTCWSACGVQYAHTAVPTQLLCRTTPQHSPYIPGAPCVLGHACPLSVPAVRSGYIARTGMQCELQVMWSEASRRELHAAAPGAAPTHTRRSQSVAAVSRTSHTSANCPSPSFRTASQRLSGPTRWPLTNVLPATMAPPLVKCSGGQIANGVPVFRLGGLAHLQNWSRSRGAAPCILLAPCTRPLPPTVVHNRRD